MKIVSSGRALNSAEFYKKKKKRRRIKFVLILLGVLAIIGALVYLSRLERFLIIDVTVVGENIVDKGDTIQAVQQLINGYYLWVIPRDNTFLYPRRIIKQRLIEGFSRLESVDLNLDEFRTLVVTVKERIPFALYCVADECFFLDKEGFIFALAPSFSDGVYFVYSTEEPIDNPIGKQLTSTENFESLLGFMKILPTLNLHPMAMKITVDDYNLLLSNGGRLIWRREDDPVLLRSNLEAFLSDDSIKVQEDFLEKVLYLDLRTTNKVFYKFK
jgi:cell division septal protein FtsQ